MKQHVIKLKVMLLFKPFIIFTVPFITTFIEFTQLTFLHSTKLIVFSTCLLISQLRSMLVVAIISPGFTAVAFRVPLLVI
jgi:hypothetical protein